MLASPLNLPSSIWFADGTSVSKTHLSAVEQEGNNLPGPDSIAPHFCPATILLSHLQKDGQLDPMDSWDLRPAQPGDHAFTPTRNSSAPPQNPQSKVKRAGRAPELANPNTFLLPESDSLGERVLGSAQTCFVCFPLNDILVLLTCNILRKP